VRSTLYRLAEQVFHFEKLAVPQHGLQRRDAGVGAQHEDAVVAGLIGQLAGVDLEGWAGLAFAALAVGRRGAP
jgi:hypothetical protein